MLSNYYTSTKVIPGYTGLYSWTPFIFSREWDAIAVTLANYLYKVFRDGTAVKMANAPSTATWISLAGGLVGYLYEYLYTTDKFTMMPIYTSKISPYLFPISKLTAGDFVDVERQLVFHKLGNGRRAEVYHLMTGELLNTITLYTGTDPGCSYHYFGEGRFISIASNGYIAIYDYVGWQTVQFSQTGVSNRAGTFDSNCNVILTCNTNGTLNVVGIEDSGNGLSSPVFTPTGNKYQYSGYVLSTRLTGAGGNPIPNAWINWELLGIKGSLEKSYSLTDANGYAWNYYWCPTDSSQLGSETVRVWYEQ